MEEFCEEFIPESIDLLMTLDFYFFQLYTLSVSHLPQKDFCH